MIEHTLSRELNIRPQQAAAAIQLLDDGATVPFIARYRKEATGALDDQQLRVLQQRLNYLREMTARREQILAAIAEQGKLSDSLKQAIIKADNKTQLEDLYQPFKSKRKTKASAAREAGLEALLDNIIQQPQHDPTNLAASHLNSAAGFADPTAALEGASAILAERLSEQPSLVQQLRRDSLQVLVIGAKVIKGQEQNGAKFRDYFDYSEQLKKIPSHRLLALLRGISDGILTQKLEFGDEAPYLHRLQQSLSLPKQGPGGAWLAQAISQCWRTKLRPKLSKELVAQQREQAEAEAIGVFSRNLKELLLAAPAGSKTTLGLDPGIRTGVKVAVVDATGKLLDYTTIYPHPPRNQWDESLNALYKLCHRHQVELISIGNGTGSRETDKLVTELLSKHKDVQAQKLIISEAGASVYSASELASHEFPDLDVTIRGAVSIARRLQDPLAELVKIEPKAIGVGQYQHDVNQQQLSAGLEAVIEDCVNAVGVDLNSASESLLARISGLNPTLASNIVSYRDEHGAFKNRRQLLKVTRLGPKAYEQAAAFLRIRGGDQVLDNSSVHPEAYTLVEQIAKQNQRNISQLIGDSHFLRSLKATDYICGSFGAYTVADILKELEKPGRDPRPEFKTARLKEGIESVSDLREGMQLEGTVTNVTNFGAFVDIGVHQDGLVHISQLADRFIKDPHDVVKPGQIVAVRVTEVDTQRNRIALSMRSESPSERQGQQGQKTAHSAPDRAKSQAKTRNKPVDSALAQALKRSGLH